MNSPLNYQYDVFISYRKTDTGKYWVSEYFVPRLKEELADILGRNVEIYYDLKELASGQSWPDALKRALVLSRCLVPVYSGSYFGSEWCSREFSIIFNRQNKCNLGCLSEPTGIIIPVLVRDGDHLPTLAKNIQHTKMGEYYTSCEAFKKSPAYMEFELLVKGFAEDVSRAIIKSPECNQMWFEKEWLDDVPIDHLFNSSEITIHLNPTLK